MRHMQTLNSLHRRNARFRYQLLAAAFTKYSLKLRIARAKDSVSVGIVTNPLHRQRSGTPNSGDFSSRSSFLGISILVRSASWGKVGLGDVGWQSLLPIRKYSTGIVETLPAPVRKSGAICRCRRVIAATPRKSRRRHSRNPISIA